MIERKIVIGFIVSTEFIQRIYNTINTRLLQSVAARRLVDWCLEYYDEFKRAPGQAIEGIFYEKLKTDKYLSKDLAEEIEQDILPSLSDEYEDSQFNVDYLIQKTEKYFNTQHLLQISSKIKSLAEENNVLEAEKLITTYKSPIKIQEAGLDLSSDDAIQRIEQAFTYSGKRVVSYPRQLGTFWNDSMVREGFVAFMAPEKRGKTFRLLDISMRARKQGAKVAFFQAGDMTEFGMLKRIAIYLAKKHYKKRYCGKMLEPVLDCILNQFDDCDDENRECDFGIFSRNEKNEKELRYEITLEELKKKYKENPDYVPCRNCKKYESNKWGCLWLKEIDVGKPLTVKEAQQVVADFFVKNKRQFKLSTHITSTLTIQLARSILDIWEKEDGFVPDLISFDYADIMEDFTMKEFRHKQNKIWADMRGLSQEKNCLVITATQANARSYTSNLLKLDNFSEDKRKFAHVTAMYGLNQDTKGREKDLGIMRINELVVREDDFNVSRQVFILQNLRRGQPFLGSYW